MGLPLLYLHFLATPLAMRVNLQYVLAKFHQLIFIQPLMYKRGTSTTTGTLNKNTYFGVKIRLFKYSNFHRKTQITNIHIPTMELISTRPGTPA